MKESAEKKILKKAYPNITQELSQRSKARHRESEVADPIGSFLDRLDRIAEKNKLGLLAHTIDVYGRHILLPDQVPQKYVEQQRRVARDQGRQGEMSYVKDERIKEWVTGIQAVSLRPWLEYMASDDAKYPTWFKYFVLRGVTQP